MTWSGATNPEVAAQFAGSDASAVEDALRLIARPQQRALVRLVGRAPSALALLDDHMCYLAHSERWCGDFGLGSRSLTGLSHYDVFPEITWFWRGVYMRALHGETLSAERDRFTREDGRVQWLDWKVWPWYRSESEVGGIVIHSCLRDGRAAAICAA